MLGSYGIRKVVTLVNLDGLNRDTVQGIVTVTISIRVLVYREKQEVRHECVILSVDQES